MKKTYYILLAFFLVASPVYSQNSDFSIDENVKKSLNIGSAKELAKNFDAMIDLDLEVKKGTFSASQAEFILKDFFQVNPAMSFQYIHQGGSSSGGQRYAIGKYVSNQNSYRVLIRFKRIEGIEQVYSISFTRE